MRQRKPSQLDRIEALLTQLVSHLAPADPETDLLEALQCWTGHHEFTAHQAFSAAKEPPQQALRDALEARAIDSAKQLGWRLKTIAARLDSGLLDVGASRNGRRFRFGHIGDIFNRVVAKAA